MTAGFNLLAGMIITIASPLDPMLISSLIMQLFQVLMTRKYTNSPSKLGANNDYTVQVCDVFLLPPPQNQAAW